MEFIKEVGVMTNIGKPGHQGFQAYSNDGDRLVEQWKQQLSYINQRKRTNVDLDTILWQLQIAKKIADRLPGFPLISLPDDLSCIMMSYPGTIGTTLIIEAYDFSCFHCCVTRVDLHKSSYDNEIYFDECVFCKFNCDDIDTLLCRVKFFFKCYI